MPIELQLKAHEKDLGGGFIVRRSLPSSERRSVGPFVFFDHFGPVTVKPQDNFDVRPHPHIGLATVTYLFEGAMMHRDSLGFSQRIAPGAINWMTAGRGIVHSERRPDDMAGAPYVNHGLQLWAGLPQAFEQVEPGFFHTAADQLPEVRLDGARVRVLIGEAFGAKSPVAVYAKTLYLDVQLDPGGSLELPALAHEMAIYPVDGPLQVDGRATPASTMAVLRGDAGATINAPAKDEATRLVVIGGDALDGPRHVWWNFVSSSRERIDQAALDWDAMRFASVPGDDERIPLPEKRLQAD